MEYVKRLSQSHSIEYDWLGPDPAQNTRGRLYSYIPSEFYSSDPVLYVTGSKVGITLSTYLRGGYYNIYMFRRSVPECDIFLFLYSREKTT